MDHLAVKHPEEVAQMIPLPYTALLPDSFQSIRKNIKLFKFKEGQEWVSIVDPDSTICGATYGMQVGFADEIEDGFYNGIAHLLEHSVFLGETVQMKSLFKDSNAETKSISTNFCFSASPDNFVEAFKSKIDLLYDFKKYPNIKDEVSAVNNE